MSLDNVSFILRNWDGEFITELVRLDQYWLFLLVQLAVEQSQF